MILFLFVLRLASAAHAYFAGFAPSNALINRVRAARPRWRLASGVGTLAAGLLAFAHAVSEAIHAGAPGCLNLLVLVAAWDAIKLGCLAVFLAARCLGCTTRSLAAKVAA